MRDAAIEHLEQLMSETCMSCMDLDEYLHMRLEPGSFEIEELSQILLTKLKMFNEQAATINFRESLIVLITKLM
jgi:hypothetical protein